MYYYYDNWTSAKRTFTSLKAAKAAAKKEYGDTINIQKEDESKFNLLVEAIRFMPS